MANAGAGTGWTSSVTPIPPATTPTTRSRRPRATETTSSTPSTATSPSTSLSASNSPATSWLGRARRQLRRAGRRDRLPGPVAPLCDGPIRALAPDARRRHRHHGPRFLGLTLRCARCHDHKFDPVSQRDYYALYGIFASTTFPYAGSEELQSKGIPAAELCPARAEPAAGRAPKSRRTDERLEPSSSARSRRIERRRTRHRRARRAERPENTAAQAAVAAARPSGGLRGTEGKPVDVPLQRRGDPGQPG